jgi:hypothetical protein
VARQLFTDMLITVTPSASAARRIAFASVVRLPAFSGSPPAGSLNS